MKFLGYYMNAGYTEEVARKLASERKNVETYRRNAEKDIWEYEQVCPTRPITVNEWVL